MVQIPDHESDRLGREVSFDRPLRFGNHRGSNGLSGARFAHPTRLRGGMRSAFPPYYGPIGPHSGAALRSATRSLCVPTRHVGTREDLLIGQDEQDFQD